MADGCGWLIPLSSFHAEDRKMMDGGIERDGERETEVCVGVTLEGGFI